MSRHYCYHCQQTTPTTATPNGVEGYFTSDLSIEGFRWLNEGETVEDWVITHGKRAGYCSLCGMISTDDAGRTEWRGGVEMGTCAFCGSGAAICRRCSEGDWEDLLRERDEARKVARKLLMVLKRFIVELDQGPLMREAPWLDESDA